MRALKAEGRLRYKEKARELLRAVTVAVKPVVARCRVCPSRERIW